MGDVPTMAMMKPMKPLIRPFTIDFPDSVIIRAGKQGHGKVLDRREFDRQLESTGAIKIRASMLRKPPIKE